MHQNESKLKDNPPSAQSWEHVRERENRATKGEAALKKSQSLSLRRLIIPGSTGIKVSQNRTFICSSSRALYLYIYIARRRRRRHLIDRMHLSRDKAESEEERCEIEQTWRETREQCKSVSGLSDYTRVCRHVYEIFYFLSFSSFLSSLCCYFSSRSTFSSTYLLLFSLSLYSSLLLLPLCVFFYVSDEERGLHVYTIRRARLARERGL